MKKRINIIFSVVFLLIIGLPLIFINWEEQKESSSENRFLTKRPQIILDNGRLNKNILADTEAWFSDNIGFRDEIVQADALMQYYVFHNISREDMDLGRNGDLIYSPEEVLLDYQHLNLWTQEEADEIVDSFQTISDYLADKGIDYYYMQCWDKHSIYPEQFMDNIFQYGDISKTDQIMQGLSEKTNVNLINMKPVLLEKKSDYELYSNWGDPTHWTQRAAYIAYQQVMDAINDDYDNQFKVLDEDFFDIYLSDQGENLYNVLHWEEYLEFFALPERTSYETNEKLTLFAEHPRNFWFTNDTVDNDTRILILTDSYINSFLLKEFGESFHETIAIFGDDTASFVDIIEAYQPDIVFHECVERVDRSLILVEVAKQMRAQMDN